MEKKSIWIEADKVLDTIWIKLAEDSGVENNHEVILNAGSLDMRTLATEIVNSDQTCFFCSFTSGTESLELIHKLLNFLYCINVQNKTFRSMGYFLDALNSGYIFPDAEVYKSFFTYNTVLEMTDGKWGRITYDEGKNRYKIG